jgi:hypothetical protein
LWHNLAGYVEKTVGRHRACWKTDHTHDKGLGSSDAAESGPAEAVPLDGEMAQPAQSRLVIRTRERYAAVQDLLGTGESLSAICRIPSLDRETVQRFARAATVEEPLGKATARTSVLDPFKPYPHQRWNGGVTEAAALAKEIAVQGYAGSEQTVRRYPRRFRGMITTPPPPADGTEGPPRHRLAAASSKRPRYRRAREARRYPVPLLAPGQSCRACEGFR